MSEKKKNNPYIKVRSIEVSSEILANKAKMQEAIEKQHEKGWELVQKRKVRNEERYRLVFEYHLSDEEIAAIKRKEANKYIGCFSIFAVCGILFFLFSMTPRETSQTPTSIPFTPLPEIYYTNMNNVYLWSCVDNGECGKETLPLGQSVQAIQSVEGRAVAGSTLWYQVALSDGRQGFIHSTVLAETRPISVPSVNNSIGAGSSDGGNTQRVPANCDEAVAMGLTAQQAAQYPSLDRDHDGVACYGD